jgi:acetyl-CoA C-acetyltransferase
MKQVAIVGVGMTSVSEHWGTSLRELAIEAVHKAVEDAQHRKIEALYVGNAYSGQFNQQTQLGALLADYVGLRGIEAYTVEAAGASGGVALRQGMLAVASGAVNCALVLGVEKATDIVGSARTKASSVSLDADYESLHGATLTGMAGLLMKRYMHEYGVELGAFEGFTMNAHANGKANPHAMYRNTIKAGAFQNAPMVAEPVSLFDSAPDGDGAAAVLLMALDSAEDTVSHPIRISGSAMATDTLALQDREHPLMLTAVQASFERALAQSGKTRDDVNFAELHDAYTILSVLSLEAMGYAEQGKGHLWGANGGEAISLKGRLPVSTFGGLKSRGNPHGASGVYQAVEATLQLRGQAGANQVPNAKVGVVQSVGGLGASVVTHILEA